MTASRGPLGNWFFFHSLLHNFYRNKSDQITPLQQLQVNISRYIAAFAVQFTVAKVQLQSVIVNVLPEVWIHPEMTAVKAWKFWCLFSPLWDQSTDPYRPMSVGTLGLEVQMSS